MTDILSIKRQKKKKNPEFIRQDAHKKVKLGVKWRKPIGIQSKMRLHLSGYRRIVQPGFGTPASLRGAIRTGEFPILVFNVSDLEKLKPGKNVVLIASSVGKRKRVEIIKKSEEKKLKILNVKNPEQYVKEIQSNVMKKKEEGISRKKKKEERQKELEKKAEEKDKKEKQEKEKKEKGQEERDPKSTLDEALAEEKEEEKKEKQEEEKKKVLIKKDM